METEPTDWDKIELDYRTGLLTNVDICRKHGISTSQLSSAASSRCWVQTMLTPEDEATVLSIAESPRFPIDSLFSPDDIKRQVLLTAGQVVKIHRDDIAKMRGITGEFMQRLFDYLEATRGAQQVVDEDGQPQIVDPKGNAIPKLLLVLGKDSPADLLEKLSRVMTRMTELERQAHGLDSMTIIPNEEEENQATKDIRALGEKLKQITADKAQKVEPKKAPVVNTGQDNAEAGKGSNA